MHKILMEESYKPTVQSQRCLNLGQDVVRKEVLQLLDAEWSTLSDSSWVSPVQVVPKKGRILVVKNDNNELIPTGTITRWRLCMDIENLITPQVKITFHYVS